MTDHNPAHSRPWWRKKRVWLAGLVALLVALFVASSLWMRSYNEAEPGGLVRTQIGEYKSTERMGLFPISLLIALRKYPGYEGCVEPRENGGSQPKWDAMTSDAQMQVCLFWIADHLGSIEATDRYFRDLGFRGSADPIPLPSKHRYQVTAACPWPPAPCNFPESRKNYRFSLSYDNGQLLGAWVDASLK